MPLTPGTWIGPYEVTGSLGAGGMGEVYRARDSKLGRDVALKVLPEAFTSDPDRLARFEREARVLASLNHTNIGHIYGLEETAGVKALVLELVEGPTLADRIAQGAMPIEDALAIARQVAEALETAHEAGVIHRDLKPANIKVREDGTVKVLDFGLAKAMEPVAGDPSVSASPTISLTAAATQMGMIIGTAAYMAPEQARGKVVDKRADIFAFGVVLYEMLTGQRPFQGEDVSLTLAAVMTFDVDLDALPSELSPTLRMYLERCLEKDPKRRLRDIGDVRLALDGAFDLPSPAPAKVAAPVVASSPWRRPAAAAAIAVLAATITGLAVWTLARPEVAPRNPVRYTITPPVTNAISFQGECHDLTISRDGRLLVYKGAANGRPVLYVRALDQLDGAPLRGGEGLCPFVSPDGDWVGFRDFQDASHLKKVATLGGPPVTLTRAPTLIFGASWADGDTIVFGTFPGGLFTVSGQGGDPDMLTEPDVEQGERAHMWPSVVSERDAVLFEITDGSGPAGAQLAVLDIASGEVRRLGLAGNQPRYVSSGHLVYAVMDGTLRAAPFDIATLEVTGGSVPLIEGVGMKPTGGANFGLSDDGRLVYAAGLGGDQLGLTWVDRAGRADPTAAPERVYQTLSLSPDGARAAVAFAEEDVDNMDVWVSDLARGTLTRITTGEGFDGNPLWSPDGRRVVFRSDRNGRPELFWQAADGSGPAELLLSMDEPVTDLYPYDWSPDGATLFVHARFPETDADIGMVALDGAGTWEPLIQTAAEEWTPVISPDGRWLAYTSNETGQFEVYVQRFPELEDRQQVSVGGGYRPTWSPDGAELLYLRSPTGAAPDAAMRVVLDIGEGERPSLSVGIPEVLFDWLYSAGPSRRYYDVSADAERFLVLGGAGSRIGFGGVASPEITVVLDWFEELKARVPVP